MKKIVKTIAVLLAAALIAAMGAMSAFAEASSADTMTDEELAELLAMLEEQGMVASGTDVSGSDALGVLSSEMLGIIELVENSFKEFGLKVLTPDYTTSGDIYSDASQLSALMGGAANADALFEISYSGFSNYIYYGAAADGSSMVAVTYTESNWSRFIGNFSDLSAEEQTRIEAGSDLIGVGDGSTASFRVINGTPMLCQEYYDTEYMAKYYLVQAVVDGGMYELYIQIASPSDADMVAADRIINSLKISGVNPQRYGVASTCTTTWLIVLVVLLFAVVALMAFFLVRFSMFAKASGSSFNIIGFDLPGNDSDDDYYDEDDGEDEDDEDNDEDDDQ